MSVITISRGSFIGGKLLAERLAGQLGYRAIDREVIVQKTAAGGVKHEDLREALLRPPSLFDRLITHKKYVYLALLQAALAEEVRDGKVVYHGYAGHLLLSDAGPVFRVRVIASPEFRVKIAQEHLKLSRHDAVAHIHKADVQRKKWVHALYGVDWEDPSLYDMVLNLGRLFDIGEACDAIVAVVRQHRGLEFTPEHRAAMHDFALASRVRAALATHALTAGVHVHVTARDGVVSVEGVFEEAEPLAEVERVVRGIPGVKDLQLKY